MELRNLIVKQYLESLIEDRQLDLIFPILLEANGYEVLSKPTEYKGFPQYGKDVIAVGIDFNDGILKRFYFELKGGDDKHLTKAVFEKNYGVRQSLLQAKYKKFESSFPNFDSLPLVIILVHNGEMKGNIQEVFEGFIKETFPEKDETKFERWGISRLTNLFSKHLFGKHLLVNEKTTDLLNRTLVNLDIQDGVYSSFSELIDILLNEKVWNNRISNHWKMTFETLRLISLIIYTESKNKNNLDIAKRYLTLLVLKFWHWILKNKVDTNKNILKYFDKIFFFYYEVMFEYCERVLPLLNIKDGLYTKIAGRYEEIGYTYRTFEFLQYFCFVMEVEKVIRKDFNFEELANPFKLILTNQSIASRPLLDIHSIPIILTLNNLLESGKTNDAKVYIRNIIFHIKWAKTNHNRMPDARNSITNVIKFIATGIKPIYYLDTASPLITVILEYIAILDMKEEYKELFDFIKKYEIDLSTFIPHDNLNSTSQHLREDVENDLEEQLFSKSVEDGYQYDLRLESSINQTLDFNAFKDMIQKRQKEFKYEYRTDKAGYPFLKDLAHIYFKTPYFPDKTYKK